MMTWKRIAFEVIAPDYEKDLTRPRVTLKYRQFPANLHCGLARLFVNAGIYDSQPAAAISR